MARAEAGRATAEKNLARAVKKGGLGESEAAAALARIDPQGDTHRFNECALVIEAATERESVKSRIYEGLHLDRQAILASNTSSISITRMGAATDRPDRFIGVHFFNPVPMMALVEIIPGLATAPATVDAVDEVRARPREDARKVRRSIGIHRQSRALPDAERGDPTAGRRCRERDRHRRGHEARRGASDGSVDACGLHRAGYAAVDHGGLRRGPGRSQVSARAPAPQNGRGGAGPDANRAGGSTITRGRSRWRHAEQRSRGQRGPSQNAHARETGSRFDFVWRTRLQRTARPRPG